MNEREGSIKEKHEVLKREVLHDIFINPSGFAEKLQLGPVKPIGVISDALLKLELERRGLPREERRKLTSEITEPLRRSSGGIGIRLPEGLIIQSLKTNQDTLYFRSDVSPSEAKRRHEAHLKCLNEELLKVRAEKEQEQKLKEERSKEKRAKKTSVKPEIRKIIVLSPYSREQLKEQIDELERIYPRGMSEPLGFGKIEIPDPSSRLISASDAEEILARGMGESEFMQLISSVRIQASKEVEEMEKSAESMVEQVLGAVKEDQRNRVIPVYIPRPLLAMFSREIKEKNFDPNLIIEDRVPEPLLEGVNPFPMTIIEAWNERLDPEKICKIIEDNQLMGSKRWMLLHGELQKENAAQALKKFMNGEPISSGAVELKPEMYLGELASILLPQVLIGKAIFADILGRIYPLAYQFEGKSREVALHSLRFLAGQFTLLEISRMLNPELKGKDRSQEIGEMERNLESLSSKIDKIKSGNWQADTRRNALIKEKTSLEKAHRRAKNEKKKGNDFKAGIENKIAQIVPAKEPNPEDYFKGEYSQGFINALNRHQLTHQHEPNIQLPNPEDFKTGEESQGYRFDVIAYKSLRFITEVGWEGHELIALYKKGVINTGSLIGKQLVN